MENKLLKMNPFDELEAQIERLSSQDSASLAERRNLLLEIEDFIHSEDYQSLSADDRNRLQTARKDLIAQIQQQEQEFRRIHRRYWGGVSRAKGKFSCGRLRERAAGQRGSSCTGSTTRTRSARWI